MAGPLVVSALGYQRAAILDALTNACVDRVVSPAIVASADRAAPAAIPESARTRRAVLRAAPVAIGETVARWPVPVCAGRASFLASGRCAGALHHVFPVAGSPSVRLFAACSAAGLAAACPTCPAAATARRAARDSDCSMAAAAEAASSDLVAAVENPARAAAWRSGQQAALPAASQPPVKKIGPWFSDSPADCSMHCWRPANRRNRDSGRDWGRSFPHRAAGRCPHPRSDRQR